MQYINLLRVRTVWVCTVLSFMWIGLAPAQTLPGETSIQSPAANATGVSTTPTMTWAAATDATAYDVQVARNVDFTEGLIAAAPVGTSIGLSLDFGTVYYARVRATNADGAGPWTPVISFTTVAGGPLQVQLVAPADGQAFEGPAVTLEWNAVAGAPGYRLQITEDPTFTSVVETGQAGLTVALTQLPLNRTYYWRVRVANGANANWSASRSFSTIEEREDPPAKVIASSPASGSILGISGVVLGWQAAERAMTYQIQLALNEGGAAFSDIVLDQQGVTGTSFPLPNLENGRIYVWRVRANNDGGAGEWSDTRGFITEAGGSTQVDTEFPDQGAQNIPVDPTEFGWLQVPGAESYHIQISRQNTFVVNRIDQQGITDTTFTTDDLDPNTLYFWRIKASNAGAANWSPTLNFTTGGLTPAPPPLRSPNDNAVGLPRTVQLVWASVADNPTYTVQVALDEQFSQPVAGASGLSDTTFTATSLDFNRRYFWRVQGVNDKGSGEWSAVRSFSTLDLAPPATPVQFAPANGAANASPQPSFGWNAATGADRYQIEISTQTNFATLVLSEETQETTFRPANVALQLSQSYFWRVRALNDAGEGVSNIWSFTVTATNVGIEQEEGVPTETTLQAAYPNPFRGQTRIGVDVAEPGDVTVQVYDVQGRQVAELIRTRLTAGRYSTVWDASDVPAGLYLVRLTTPDTDRVQRVVKVQ